VAAAGAATAAEELVMAEGLGRDEDGSRLRHELARLYWEQTAERALQQLQARLDALRSMSTHRVIEVEEWRANGEDLLRRDN
jgi:hypothetical protein